VCSQELSRSPYTLALASQNVHFSAGADRVAACSLRDGCTATELLPAWHCLFCRPFAYRGTSMRLTQLLRRRRLQEEEERNLIYILRSNWWE
jgi:hypothetical protein